MAVDQPPSGQTPLSGHPLLSGQPSAARSTHRLAVKQLLSGQPTAGRSTHRLAVKPLLSDSMSVIVCISIAANFQKLGSLTVPCLCTRNCSARHVQLKAGHQAEHQEDGKQLGKQLEWGGKEACSKVGELLRSKARGVPEV